MALYNYVYNYSWYLSSASFSVVLTTDPPGPAYKAGTLFTVHCSVVNGSYSSLFYYYQLYYGCTYTGEGNADTLYDYGRGYQLYNYYFATTRHEVCHNIFMCRAIDTYSSPYGSAVGQLTIEIVTGQGCGFVPYEHSLFISF